MTLIKPNGDDGAPDEILSVAIETFEDAIKVLGQALDELSGGNFSADPEIKKAAAALRGTTQTLFQERKRIDDLRRKETGVAHEFGFDFDGVRTEIRRRLDSLRTA